MVFLGLARRVSDWRPDIAALEGWLECESYVVGESDMTRAELWAAIRAVDWVLLHPEVREHLEKGQLGVSPDAWFRASEALRQMESDDAAVHD